MSDDARVVRTILWSCRRLEGVEYFTLRRSATGWLLGGTVAGQWSGRPLVASYSVSADPEWRTRQVQVELTSGDEHRTLALDADGSGSWRGEGVPLEPLRGCLDVDLSITPSTNTLPIRRLGLRDGQSAELTAAWVRFPELDVRPLKQSYDRLSELQYRYRSENGPDPYDLRVDDLGLVRRYADLWEATAVL